MIILGVLIWAVFAGHPWVALFLLIAVVGRLFQRSN